MIKIPCQGDCQENGNIAGVAHEPILMQGLDTEDDQLSPTKGKTIFQIVRPYTNYKTIQHVCNSNPSTDQNNGYYCCNNSDTQDNQDQIKEIP